MPTTTINTLNKLKAAGEHIACLTCYDASFAKLMQDSDLDVILVGDSLGMTMLGHDSTVPVTVNDIAYHTRSVLRGCPQGALIIGDLPFMSYHTPERAMEAATQLMQAGAHMVKLEGGLWIAETVKRLTACGIPVCAHIGLQPQSIHALGKYATHGKTTDEAQRLTHEALALEASGAAMIVFECIEANLADKLTKQLSIPTIGIGSGAGCDGQILVLQDILGMRERSLRFVEVFLNPHAPTIQAALAAYIQAVKSGEFPKAEHAVYAHTENS